MFLLIKDCCFLGFRGVGCETAAGRAHSMPVAQACQWIEKQNKRLEKLGGLLSDAEQTELAEDIPSVPYSPFASLIHLFNAIAVSAASGVFRYRRRCEFLDGLARSVVPCVVHRLSENRIGETPIAPHAVDRGSASVGGIFSEQMRRRKNLFLHLGRNDLGAAHKYAIEFRGPWYDRDR